MQQGAFNYLLKPLDLNQLRAVADKAARSLRLRRANAELNRRLDEKFGFEGVIGNSPQMHDVIDRLKRIAPTDASVLIQGETAPARNWWPRPSTRTARGRTALRGAQLRGAEREHPGERAVRPRARGVHRRLEPTASASSNTPTAARCFSTKWATCRWPRRSSCCACWRAARSPASARTSRSRSTCGSCRPPTATWKRRSPPARFAAIFTTG